jgi:beta-lactamase superfamily II metal-dependent hydrolase
MLKIHFLNVGHGDCCIVEFLDNKRIAMIDINRSANMDYDSAREVYESQKSKRITFEDYLNQPDLSFITNEHLLESGYDIELQDPLQYLRDNNLGSIFRFISTHPHIDHLTGLSELSEEFNIVNAWIIKNQYKPNIDNFTNYQKRNWRFYEKLRDTTKTEVDDIKIVRPREGYEDVFYADDGIQILTPNKDLINSSNNNANNLSYVLLIKHKGRKILLPGDAEENIWRYLVENYESDISDIDILKAAHHGRDSGYYRPAVEIMSPLCTIVSVGKKPDTDAQNKYRRYSDEVWSTRWKGNIIFTIKDDGVISYRTQYNR